MSPCDEFVRCTFSNAAVSVLRFRHPRPAGHWGCNGSTHLWVQFAWQVASVAPFLLVFLFWKHGILHSAASLVGSFLFFHWFALLLDLRGLLQWPGKDYGDVQLPGRRKCFMFAGNGEAANAASWCFGPMRSNDGQAFAEHVAAMDQRFQEAHLVQKMASKQTQHGTLL